MGPREPVPERAQLPLQLREPPATCHQLKTAGYTDILDSKADGSCTWVTAWGQRIHVPPRSVLPPEPDPPPPAEPAPPTPEDPPHV